MQIPDNDTLTKYDPYIEPGDGAWDQYLEDMYEDRMLAEDPSDGSWDQYQDLEDLYEDRYLEDDRDMVEYLEDYED